MAQRNSDLIACLQHIISSIVVFLREILACKKASIHSCKYVFKVCY